MSEYDSLTLEAILLASSSSPNFNFSITLPDEEEMRDACVLMGTFAELGLVNKWSKIDSLLHSLYFADPSIRTGSLIDATKSELSYMRSMLKIINVVPYHGGGIQSSTKELLTKQPQLWEKLADFALSRNLGLGQIDAEQFKQSQGISTSSLQSGVL